MSFVLAHQQFIKSIREVDFDAERQCTENYITMDTALCAEKSRYQKKLSALRITVNRRDYFLKTLNEWLELGIISPEKKEAILKYIDFTKKEKILLGKGFGVYPFFIMNCDAYGLSYQEDTNLWATLNSIGKQVDQEEDKKTLEALVGDKHTLYCDLKDKLNANLIRAATIDKEYQLHEKRICDLFKSEIIASVADLKALCDDSEGKKLELLVIESDSDETDYDFAAVIQMRANKNIEKGRDLVVLSFEQFEKLMEANEPIDGITKLSFLHHGSKEFGYVERMASYIDNLPYLKRIVLRGCSTAGDSCKTPDMTYVAHKTSAPYEEPALIQGDNQLIVQQKEMPNGTLLTKLSWWSENSHGPLKIELKDIEGIEKITQKKLTDEQLQALENIPGVPFLRHSNEYIALQRSRFFNQDQALSKDELAQAKKAMRRSRTELISCSDLEHSRLRDVLEKMTDKQKESVSVKAYFGAYGVNHGRVVPVERHGQSKFPKAARVGPKGSAP